MLKKSLEQGYKESRLPSFTDEEKDFVKGTADFYGINYYYLTLMIRPAKPGEDNDIWFLTGSPELNAKLDLPPITYKSLSELVAIYPQSFRKQMKWLKEQYGDIDFLITESGLSSASYNVIDRAEFYKEHIGKVLMSIKMDNISVIGYSAWSLIDSFEWMDGYSSEYGLYQVDFKDPDRKRSPRPSAHLYACMIKNRSLNDTCLNEKYEISTLSTNESKQRQ